MEYYLNFWNGYLFTKASGELMLKHPKAPTKGEWWVLVELPQHPIRWAKRKGNYWEIKYPYSKKEKRVHLTEQQLDQILIEQYKQAFKHT